MTPEVIAFFLFVGVAALGAAVAFRVIKRHARNERQAHERADELEQRIADKQDELSKNFKRLNKLAVVRMVSAERERIMREMHDGMGGNLVSTLAMIESGDFDKDELSEAIRGALDDMRLVIDSLDPDVDDIPTLLAMVRCRLEPRLRRRGLRFDWRVDDLPELDGMGPEQYLHILRIVQESITNIIKHAEAKTIVVSTRIDEAGDNAIVVVEDDGGGIDEHATRGRGLQNMKHRAAELGGTIDIASIEEGTRVELRIPLGSDGSSTRSLRHRTITGLD
jgi:signal transduction histidine kinase